VINKIPIYFQEALSWDPNISENRIRNKGSQT